MNEKDTELDFMKWICDKTIHYDFESGIVYYTYGGDEVSVFSENRGILNPGLYRDLLQSAIEGVNRDSDYEIIQSAAGIEIYYSPDGSLNTAAEFNGDDNIKNKESALRWVSNREDEKS